MLRPATPLTVLFLIAFILLLLSTLSVPVIKAIPLASNNGTSFGVFGYCQTGPGGICSNATVGYSRSEIFEGSQNSFDVVAKARVTLSYILIVHPIAAFMVLICTFLAGAAHFRSPAHSPRFLLGLLIFTFPTLLVTLLAFLIDILLFIPHLSWGGWIVLPATIIVTACGVLTCAMRRTLVSRKARKKRVAENADMNGSEYYAMKAEIPMRSAEPDYVRAESPPPMDNIPMTGGTATYDKTAQPSTYEYDRSRGSMDDRVPLNPRNAASGRTGANGRSNRSNERERLNGSTMIGGPRDGANDDLMDPVSPMEGPPRRSSDSQARGRGRGSMAPPYGRGGGPPNPYGRGRGGYPPRAGPRGDYYQSRGNYPSRGAYPPRGGPRGTPPPGWGMSPRGGPMMRGRPPPPGYGNSRSPPRSMDRSDSYGPPQERQQQQPWPPQDAYTPEEYADDQAQPAEAAPYAYDQTSSPTAEARALSTSRDPKSFGFSGRHPSPARSQTVSRPQTPPPPMPALSTGIPGQAIELDGRNQFPSSAASGYDDRIPSDALGEQAPRGDHAAGTYLPMDAWRSDPVELGDRSPPIPQRQGDTMTNTHELPAQAVGTASQHRPRHRASSGSYYEDVDPRFSSDDPQPPIPAQSPVSTSPPPMMPSSLLPGAGAFAHPYSPENTYLVAPIRDDSHSPAHSDNSNFTSISQRGINPDWRGEPSGYNPRPAPRARQDDALLSNNPDFVVPGAGPLRGHARGTSSGAGGRYPNPAGI